MDESEARSKRERLLARLGLSETLLVAFSGGVDSSFLLALAHQALGEGVTAVTAASPVHPRRELEEARRFTGERGINHVILRSGETEIPEFVSNTPDRCYHCKKALCREFLRLAVEKGISHVAHGANTDDLQDFRPGFRATEETGVMAPLIDAGLCKDEIRFLARDMGLPQWDRPSMACLASRFPYGTPITEEGLRMVEAAEDFLLKRGFMGLRVRHHGSVARIELSLLDLERMVEEGTRETVVAELRHIGFEHIALDLEGHISGKMNRGLSLGS
ncbi:MAG: ATP-dependent sacrificial sulfur transferase LarE [Deltaproteobacteria bacterium]|nr:ATP-dependent sacrificial sulfur transferase LarE [Deltaproteobacteria bacterium]MBW2049520.1 ATP-dependent sacrificial sulfur transferase LarE [Deltaproteobacteria bacterium]MBW2110647.1 ATP-dependent sacrificial sulfur transferase LarE [Deltaproteobacteria bacterium]MBW2354299.1 ATP-dependent sacrificial sulfur transferase LarE [Deltaproteobacteria bacterium]HDZ90888.1 ATP-dependent sacrificial sulfur transferase LarE [Deltaproteobacteria bacterium]